MLLKYLENQQLDGASKNILYFGGTKIIFANYRTDNEPDRNGVMSIDQVT